MIIVAQPAQQFVRQRKALTVYVAEKRYTKEFMDNSEYFTVMSFDVKDSKVLNYEVVNAWKK